MNPWGCVHLFSLTLRGRISRPAGYLASPRTLADHLRKVRLDRGLPQKDATREIGFPCSLANS